MFADVHCHLDRSELRTRLDDVIANARGAGLGCIITAGVTPETNDDALAIAARFPDIVRCSLGMYPLDAIGFNPDNSKQKPLDVDAELARMESLAHRCVAIGEVGLDFKFTKDPQNMAKQRDVFAKVLALAERIKKPVVIHSRSAEQECIEMLETADVDVLMHCFMGRKSLMRRAIDNGWSFSIPAIINRSQSFQILAGMAPIEQLLTETDAPWMSPVQGIVNEPRSVIVGAEGIAKAKRMDLKVIEEQLWQNTKRLFRI